MSYQVLARKWRPQTFHQLVGQSHVKQALVNALTQNRLHHAYLFTGTRGVGKTTIARIFAKSLNCDEGISANPCGQCSSCRDIEAGRYIDLLEIDAASRTKVEDTREILDNVQYAPTRGRYKVYLIDEVHMLSKHSFNALLKTLEEPPEHVKFLLATTDPQKLPVTILSRCLQFNLNALSQLEIKTQLQHVLKQEQLNYDDESLNKIAKAADGSMRDALSLTDQAIAQTGGDINNQAVQSMLGLMDTHYSQSLFAAVLAQDANALMTEINQVASKNPQYYTLLDDLIALTHLIQLTQLVPEAAALDEINAQYVQAIAQQVEPQQIQVYYQLLLNGKKDLQWAPEPKLGFEMILLRLLAFEPMSQHHQRPSNETTTHQTLPSERTNTLREIINKNKQNIQPDDSSMPIVDNTVDTTANDIQQRVDNDAAKLSVSENTVLTTPANNEENNTQPNVIDNSPRAEESINQNPSHQSDENLHERLEQDIAAQFDDVMNSAQEQGFNPSEASAETAKNISVTDQDANAQSAIARILQDRNISGTGYLGQSSAPLNSEQKAVRTLQSQSQNTDKERLNEEQTNEKKPNPQEFGAQANVTKKPARKIDFKNKHQTITENLAPELLQQINPQKKAEIESDDVSIPIPDDFHSPISEIRFAHQQNEWAYLIKRMGLGGRIRQFALHSIFTKQDNNLHIQVDESQKHLDTAVLRQKLNHALSSIYDFNVELNIEFAKGVIDSPFLIQQKIDAQRHQQAVEAIAADNNVIQFQQIFNAEIDENSIQAL
ncbi:DNA polymerase III subunit gamma/tau [Pseudoalteromonas sp. MMG010]|uniref:DNA polymerase III subunit gamma/tau n=1 Tax=Pseudoalteromonas sp. MMG010 TaxID=2822685 RepID=UPI001B3A05AD|nr:DNA polymerase III subunit gamma/tau [Pseudoalteromonas sp. MMG010]MBQ4833249.1 DNA polymerase III subunit gamma/tau [Pseudoalteromonas sp. MMG010]